MGPKFAPGVHKTLSATFPHPAPRSSCPFRGHHQKVRELFYSQKITLLTLGEWREGSCIFQILPSLNTSPASRAPHSHPSAQSKDKRLHCSSPMRWALWGNFGEQKETPGLMSTELSSSDSLDYLHPGSPPRSRIPPAEHLAIGGTPK